MTSAPDDNSRVPDPALARLQRRRAAAETDLALLPDTAVKDPRGGISTVAQLGRRLANRREELEARRDEGRHRRVSRLHRVLMRLLPPLDLVVLFWFLVGVLNVDLEVVDPVLGVAVALAVLGSIALAAWAHVVGEHLQRYADGRGELSLGALDVVARAMLVVTMTVWALVGAMMFVRVHDEVFQATGASDAAGTVIALVMTAAIVVLNVYVLYLAFADGSLETRELDRLARVVLPHLRRQERLVRRIADLTERLSARAAARSASTSRAGRPELG
ncbi:hypothetical protein [Actinomycetospora atypica]|uniref:Integral membrane protein n=1 Tax=Actinomycetospora atypica TaxID=1290095 RepID=A0ABV9YJJ8_9PSEU